LISREDIYGIHNVLQMRRQREEESFKSRTFDPGR
jgi:hypothetical protein